jgi:ornithine cyclodeaminase/alanine dehydrogenase-like protein (mu-crystallin family)
MQASHQVTPEEADEALADIDAVWLTRIRTASLGAACG